MKKFKTLILLLVCCLVLFSGCSNATGILKTQPTNLSLTDFFNNNYLNRLINMQDSSYYLYNQEDVDTAVYEEINPLVYQIIPEQRALMCAVDAYSQINAIKGTELENTELFNTVYEFADILDYETFTISSGESEGVVEYKCVVYVEAVKDKDNRIKVKSYYYPKNVDYTLEELKNDSSNYQNKTFEFTFNTSKTKIEEKRIYAEISYGGSASYSAIILFDKNEGYLNCQFITKIDSYKDKITSNLNVYAYYNGTNAIRNTVRYSLNNIKKISIYEQVDTELVSKLKFGIVEDYTKVLDMTNLKLGDLAKNNLSDKTGYIFEKTINETFENEYIITQYSEELKEQASK